MTRSLPTCSVSTCSPSSTCVRLPAGHPRVARGRGRARHVPDQPVVCGDERSLMGTPASRLTRTIVGKAVPEKYSQAVGRPAPLQLWPPGLGQDHRTKLHPFASGPVGALVVDPRHGHLDRTRASQHLPALVVILQAQPDTEVIVVPVGGGQDRAAGPVRPGTGHPAAQHHHLTAQQQDLRVLGCPAAPAGPASRAPGSRSSTADGQTRTAILPYPRRPRQIAAREPASSIEAVQVTAATSAPGSSPAYPNVRLTRICATCARRYPATGRKTRAQDGHTAVRVICRPPVPTEPQYWDSPTAAGRRNPRRGGARGHRTTVISLGSALCLPLRVVLVEGRHEGKPGGLHDIRGRRPDRNPAARQLHLELDLSDRLAARAD